MLMLLSVDAVAQFQPWLAPGAKVDAGVRLGDLELHPRVAAEAEALGLQLFSSRRATLRSSLSCQAAVAPDAITDVAYIGAAARSAC